MWLLRHFVGFVVILSGRCNGFVDMSNLVAHWTMDTFDERILYSDDPARASDLQVDISGIDTSKAFVDGINGTSLQLEQEELVFMKDIKRTCLPDLNRCTDGLSLIFWINIDQLFPNEYQVIIRTTSSEDLPGVSITANEVTGQIQVFMYMNDDSTRAGKKYRAAFPSDRLLDHWTHFAMPWTKDEGIKIFLNGTELPSGDYVSPPSVESTSTGTLIFTDLEVGYSLGPVFTIDDMWIFYRNLSETEIRVIRDASSAIFPETVTKMVTEATTVDEGTEAAEVTKPEAASPSGLPETVTKTTTVDIENTEAAEVTKPEAAVTTSSTVKMSSTTSEAVTEGTGWTWTAIGAAAGVLAVIAILLFL